MAYYTPIARYYVVFDRLPLLVWTEDAGTAADSAACSEYGRGVPARVVRCETTDDLAAAIAREG